MHKDNSFYEKLTRVPPVPENALINIEKKIRRNAAKKQLIYTIAAMVFLSITASTWHITTKSTTASLQPEVASELQIARDFLNGDDIVLDDNQYALIENDF